MEETRGNYSVGSCHDLKGYLACGCNEIATVGLQDAVIHKDTEVSSSKLLCFIKVT